MEGSNDVSNLPEYLVSHNHCSEKLSEIDLVCFEDFLVPKWRWARALTPETSSNENWREDRVNDEPNNVNYHLRDELRQHPERAVPLFPM